MPITSGVDFMRILIACCGDYSQREGCWRFVKKWNWWVSIFNEHV